MVSLLVLYSYCTSRTVRTVPVVWYSYSSTIRTHTSTTVSQLQYEYCYSKMNKSNVPLYNEWTTVRVRDGTFVVRAPYPAHVDGGRGRK